MLRLAQQGRAGSGRLPDSLCGVVAASRSGMRLPPGAGRALPELPGCLLPGLPSARWTGGRSVRCSTARLRPAGADLARPAPRQTVRPPGCGWTSAQSRPGQPGALQAICASTARPCPGKRHSGHFHLMLGQLPHFLKLRLPASRRLEHPFQGRRRFRLPRLTRPDRLPDRPQPLPAVPATASSRPPACRLPWPGRKPACRHRSSP
jgi:hypothetical protein